MNGVSYQPPLDEDRLSRSGQPPPHACEFERAYSELLEAGGPGTRPAARPCSGLGSEVRAFPVSPSGHPYFLCNGHLRDLFEGLEHLGTAVP
jgi:hypothetical protein